MKVFGCKVYCFFRMGEKPIYEERVLRVAANSSEEAMEMASSSNCEYAKKTGSHPLDFVRCYEAKEYCDSEGVSELYSLMRISGETFESYLDRFEDTGFELEEDHT